MSLPLPPPLPPCRPIVLGAGAPKAALEATLGDLLADRDLDHDQPIEVFATPSAAFAAATQARRLRWHAPRSDLAAAVSEVESADVDVAWLVAGVRVPQGSLLRLQSALHAEPAIGTASPLCPGDPLFSPLDEGKAIPVRPEALDAWLAENGSRWPVELPAPLACCGVLRGSAVSALAEPRVGGAGSWPQALSRSGWLHVACTRVMVTTTPGTPAALVDDTVPPDSTLLASRGTWRDAHPLTGLRWTLGASRSAFEATDQTASEAIGAGRGNPVTVRLHVAHSWGGGLSAWVKDFCDADEGAEDLVLRSIGVVGAYGQRLALYRGSESTEPLRIWELGLPIHASAIVHLQYRAVLQEIAADFAVDCVIVSSLIGHSLDALRTGLPTVIVAHDHYPFCVAIFAYHGGECRSCDRVRLEHCLAANPGHRFFNGVTASDWLSLRDAFCQCVRQERITIVAPSPSVRERWRALMPALADSRFEIIAHGTSISPAVAFDPPQEGPLRLIKLGRLSMEKGGEVLEAMLPRLADFAHVTLLGCGEDAARLGRRRGVTAIATFAREDLPALIAEARPHLGLQLSLVPETFSYTLSELWHCGVPVMASRIGSLADRIRDGDNGYLVATTSEAVLARLREIDRDRGTLSEMRGRLLAAPTRTREQMVADYRALLPCWHRRRVPLLDAGAGSDRSTGRTRLGPISVDPEVTYLQAARAFARYTLAKAAHSPRLPKSVRRLLGGR